MGHKINRNNILTDSKIKKLTARTRILLVPLLEDVFQFDYEFIVGRKEEE